MRKDLGPTFRAPPTRTTPGFPTVKRYSRTREEVRERHGGIAIGFDVGPVGGVRVLFFDGLGELGKVEMEPPAFGIDVGDDDHRVLRVGINVGETASDLDRRTPVIGETPWRYLSASTPVTSLKSLRHLVRMTSTARLIVPR